MQVPAIPGAYYPGTAQAVYFPATATLQVILSQAFKRRAIIFLPPVATPYQLTIDPTPGGNPIYTMLTTSAPLLLYRPAHFGLVTSAWYVSSTGGNQIVACFVEHAQEG